MNILSRVGTGLDLLQFACKSKRGVENSGLFLLHSIAEYRDKRPGNYARLLFVDFSSAFNTMCLSILVRKLLSLGVDGAVCRCTLSHQLQRPQRVRVTDTLSGVRHTNIGATQGCVLSPVLFTVYTNSHTSKIDVLKVIKYTDDTVLVGLINEGLEDCYLRAAADFVRQCDYELNLNVIKTEEMIIEFRRVKAPHAPMIIKDTEVRRVDSHKYLGFTVQHNMRWQAHIVDQRKKATQRIYHLRKPKKSHVDRFLLELFYLAVIQSILMYTCTL